LIELMDRMYRERELMTAVSSLLEMFLIATIVFATSITMVLFLFSCFPSQLKIV